MSTARDMTQRAFDAACERRGFKPHGCFGYYELGAESRVSVSVFNAGERRRDKLAFLIQQRASVDKRLKCGCFGKRGKCPKCD